LNIFKLWGLHKIENPLIPKCKSFNSLSSKGNEVKNLNQMKDDNQSESHSIDGLPHSDGDGNSSDASDDELSLTVELQ
jgi:hypothetical protein